MSGALAQHLDEGGHFLRLVACGHALPEEPGSENRKLGVELTLSSLLYEPFCSCRVGLQGGLGILVRACMNVLTDIFDFACQDG